MNRKVCRNLLTRRPICPVSFTKCVHMCLLLFAVLVFYLQCLFFIHSIHFLFAEFVFYLKCMFFVSCTFLFAALFCLLHFFFYLQCFFFVCIMTFFFIVCPIWAIVLMPSCKISSGSKPKFLSHLAKIAQKSRGVAKILRTLFYFTKKKAPIVS